MKTRVILTTLVAFLLLVAVTAAGLNAVFTVTNVRSEFRTYSADGERDAAALRTELDGFVGASTTFFDLDEIRGAVEKYPCFRLEEVKKEFPSTLRVVVRERRETFAVALEEGGYAVLDEEGNYLYGKEENVNRVFGANILLEGFDPISSAGTPGGAYFDAWREVASVFEEALTEIRANVVSVTLMRTTSVERNDFFRIRMREGVVVDIGNPSFKPTEKAQLAVRDYLALADEERIFGFITVVDSPASGEVLPPDYSRESNLT